MSTIRTALILLACSLCSIVCGQSSEARQKCNRGIEFYHQGELDKAIAEFSAAIEIDPRDAFGYKCRSYVFDSKGELDRALSDLNDALTLEPRDSMALFNRGSLWRRKGDYKKALADFDEAIVIDSTNKYAFINRGTLWIEQGNSEKSLSDYDRAIEIDPKLAEAYSGRAWIFATSPLSASRNGARSVADAVRANELSGWKRPDQIDTLAAAYAELGKFDEAVKYQMKAIELADDQKLLRDFRSRLSLYRSEKPYRWKIHQDSAPKR